VIHVDPDILSGTPCFAGTRVPVQTLWDHLKAGDRIADFLEDFPTVTHEQADAVIEIAAASVQEMAVRGDAEFAAIVERVLRKNSDLYRRLA
jgi:uncharacterized protein (DUF433 family)